MILLQYRFWEETTEISAIRHRIKSAYYECDSTLLMLPLSPG